VRLAVAAVATLSALAAPATAFAHATLVRTVPANGATVAAAPRTVIVQFDDTVRVGSGTAAVANATHASVLDGSPTARGDVLRIPLRPDLSDGDYSVRWSIVSDDGHPEEGLVAFAVGAGSAAPASILGASTPLGWSDVLFRTLYYLGLLTGGGAVTFGLLTRRLLGATLERPLAHLLFISLLLAFLGGSGIAQSAPSGTRFALVLRVALVVAVAGGAAAALAPRAPRLVAVAGALALALLVAPTLSGHSLDRNQPAVLAPLADAVHVAAAAVWLGGLLSVVLVLPRVTADPALRTAAARRFSSAALAAVLVLGATGVARAVTELSSVSQLWSTSYGRALIAKTAVFVPLLAVGWLNRALLIRVFERLRRAAGVEAAAIGGIVVAVAILTELRPGADTTRALATPLAAAGAPSLPPRAAVVDARELGPLAVAVAREPVRTTVTLLGPDGTGVDGRIVRIGDFTAEPCGSGCYRAPSDGTGPLRVSVDGRSLTFGLSPDAPGAARLLASVTRAYRSSRTIVWDETLASTPTNATTTRFTAVAPHRLSFFTRGGPAGIVIGGRRWDRAGDGATWVASPQSPLDVTQPYWSRPTNVHLVAPHTITFLDRSIPAWFRVTLVRGRPAVQQMTAAAHFMTDRYVGFDVPATVSPPSR
jgi:copper transport protein